ncbi:hypothetical protein QFZ77_007449 [Paenibacillus sp. V4I3]|uniref:sporulation histidine kinase inhibitor Sda n=1 Tax=unclassified Paenibacillus TaxID=185978 RepID=UPI0027885FB7|nr:hypothetical protein [Paenibacillus sp. V4I3]MDQ0885358.1 hypothetical protein [Paenibacillus sp. V4I9]
MWSLSDEELLNILNEATKLKLDTKFIEMIQYQIHLRKLKIDYSLIEENFNIKLANVEFD